SLQAGQAFDEQSCSDEQHHRESDFGDNKYTSQSSASRVGCGASAFFQRLVQVGLGALQRRGDAEDEPGQHRNPKRKAENSLADCDSRHSRQVFRRKSHQEIDGPSREQQAERAAHKRKQQALDEQLPKKPRAARSHRRANREFLFSGGGSREQQVGYVRARDQQHNADRRQQQQQLL